MTAEECLKIAKRLAKHPTQSTKHMEEGERTDGIEQMLKDLLALAHAGQTIASLRAALEGEGV